MVGYRALPVSVLALLLSCHVAADGADTLIPGADGSTQVEAPTRGAPAPMSTPTDLGEPMRSDVGDEGGDISTVSPPSERRGDGRTDKMEVEMPGPEDERGPALSGDYDFPLGKVSVEAVGPSLARTYTMSSTATLRSEWPSEVTIVETETQPILRSGNLLWDALFAMAVQEARENETSTLSDAAFDSTLDCACYTTGALWNWVWTRDIAYATDLGLAWLNPERAAASLRVKLSEPKGGGAAQIVQDTGTGGSWPVSTDRVVWALGARAVLPFLPPDTPFRSEMLAALGATSDVDRSYVYDDSDGLYRGETSFLDWREQSYATWTAKDPVHIASSKALSTNLAHLIALRVLARDAQAQALEESIQTAFWSDGSYRSFISGPLDGTPVAQQDLLGSALASLELSASPPVMATYPFAPGGPPVIWPQQPFRPIYHNRGAWPFVTAYAMLAARREDNALAFDRAWSSLVSTAAVNLSHLENVEAVSGANYVSDGDFSGPVINSRRQLWSVAGFLGAVVRGVFGMEASDQGVRFKPFMTHADWFGATLHRFPFRGGQIDITLSPEGAEQSAWLQSGSHSVGAAVRTGGAITEVDLSDWRFLYAPQEAEVTLEGETLSFSGETGVSFEVWGDGELLELNASSPYSTQAGVCYHVRTRLELSQHVSQPSAPTCDWPEGSVLFLPPDALSRVGGALSNQHGRSHIENWGLPEHSLTFEVQPIESGRHGIQLVYGNGGGSESTGITCGVKRVSITDALGVEVQSGTFVMPQLGNWSRWADSALVFADLEAGVVYQVHVTDGFNMSYLDHYQHYAATGGGPGPWNYVNIAGAKVLRL